MDSEEAIATAETLLGQSLSGVQELVFRQAWDGKSYECMADLAGYDCGYLKDVGSKLWRSLSSASGQKTTKANFRGLIERYQYRQEIKSDPTPKRVISPQKICSVPANDTPFHDRTAELITLSQWILEERCRLISILGLGGIGKTSLAATLTVQLSDRFEFVIWRSLRSTPTPTEVLQYLLKDLSPNPDNCNIPTAIDAQIDALLLHLRQHRCAIVLDNFESILQSNHMRGCYLTGYEGYGQLLRCLAESSHQSCLLFTSRERPIGLSRLADPSGATRILSLKGLSLEACHRLLDDRALERSPQETQRLAEFYGGNPLALKLAAASVRAFFAGNVGNFLQQHTAVFGDLWDLLDRQFERLCPFGQRLMYWLALQQGSTSLAELQANLPGLAPHALLGALDSLRGRSLVETNLTDICQPELVTEYVLMRLIDRCSREILERSPKVLTWQPLLSTQPESQPCKPHVSAVLQPIVAQLSAALGDSACVKRHLVDFLEQLETLSVTTKGFAEVNVAELLASLQQSEVAQAIQRP